MTDQTRHDLLRALCYAAVTAFFAAYICFVPPTVFDAIDFVRMWKPIWHFLRESVGHGTVPLWNPYIGLSRPFLADAQIALFYPPTYLVCLGPQLGVFLFIWLHCFIGASGARQLGKSLDVSEMASHFTAFCFLGSGALTGRWAAGQVPYCCSLCYAPWLFYFAVRSIEPWSFPHTAMYAATLALQFLCGNPHVFWITTVGQAVFIIARSAVLPARAAFADLLRSGAQFSVALLWCISLVAVELLPFAELVIQANRNAPSRDFANFLKLQWSDLGNFFSPMGIFTTAPVLNWEQNLFIGTTATVLGIVGLCRVRERNVRGLLAMLMVALLIGLGNSTPAFELFYRWLPGFSSLRIHSRAGFLAGLALICAAGIFLSRPHPKLRALWNSKTRLPVSSILIGLFLLQAVDVLQAAHRLKNSYSYASTYSHLPDFPFQFFLVDHLRAAGLMQPGQPPPRVSVPERLITENFAMIHGYSTFDADFSLFLRRDWDYLHRMVRFNPNELINTRVPNAVYELGPFPYADLSLTAGINPADDSLVIVTNTSPRAFLIYSAEVLPSYEDVLSRLAAGHDIHRSALLEKPLPRPLPKSNPRAPALTQIHNFEPDSFLVDVDAREDALLVIGESWYPGWKAEIDGRNYESVPVNAWMRGFLVPAGKHQVRVFFHQDYLRVGAAISCAGAILLLVVFVRGKRKKSSSA